MAGNEGDKPQESPYAGRWVARIGGQVVAHGGTPGQAQRLARMSRYKERVEIAYMPHAGFALPPLVDAVHRALPDQEIYLVGGAVRDAFLGHVSHDIDFAVPTDAIGLARRVANALAADFYVLDAGFDTARVIVRGEASQGARDYLDFSSFRPGKDGLASRRAAQGGSSTIEDDLLGRDFTINAIAYDLRGDTILDPLNGARDLRAKLIRMCSPTSLRDDPIRILRGVRLAAALDFKIDPATRASMKEAVTGLPDISPERQRDELFKTLDGRRPDASLRALEMLDVFPYMLHELSAMKGVQQSPPHTLDVWEHTLSVLQHLDGILNALAPYYDADKNSDLFTGLLSLRLGRYREQLAAHLAQSLNSERSMRALLFFIALYHDVAKPETRTVEEGGRIRFFGHDIRGAETAATRARAFNLSNDEVERVGTTIRNHMRIHFHTQRMQDADRPPSRRAIYRFFRDTGEAGVDVVLLGLADVRGTRGPTLTQEAWTSALDTARILMENYWERPHEAVSPPRILDGNEAMHELGLQPGPLLGQLLGALREAQAEGRVSDREQALVFGREWLHKRGEIQGSDSPDNLD